MKKVLKKQKVEVSDDLEMHKFRVAASAEMFELLASSLYSRKYEAVVRELSCNAYDAHIQAGREDKPFEIQFPTAFNANFFVRDYGPGLTPDQVKNLYTVMGLSDKTHTNTMVGAFGVGSKSPFSVTRHFSIESFQGGKKWTWAALLDEDNIPSITLADEVFTDEPDGLKISFASPTNNEWVEAVKALMWFDVKPICNLQIPEKPEFSVVGDDWAFVERKDVGYYYRKQQLHNFYCVMGNVMYEVDKTKLVYNNVPNGDYYFFVDIGDVSPAASREYLRYDSKTTEFLRKLVKKIEKEIKEEAWRNIQSAEDVYKAIDIWSKNVQLLKLSQFEYKGKKYETRFKERRPHTSITSTRADRHDIFTHSITRSSGRAVIWADEVRAKNIRANKIRQEEGYEEVYLFDDDCKDVAEACAMPYHTTSEVEYEEVKKSGNNGPSEAAKKDMLLLNGSNWEPIEGDVPQKAWWVQIGWNFATESKEPVEVKQSSYNIHSNNLRKRLEHGIKAGIEPGFPIVGVKTRALDEIPKTWIHYKEFFKGMIEFLHEYSLPFIRRSKIGELRSMIPSSVWMQHHEDLEKELEEYKKMRYRLYQVTYDVSVFYDDDVETDDVDELMKKAEKAFPSSVFRYFNNNCATWRKIANEQDYP